MAYLGTLIEWNDQRGFGFVQADEGGDKVFVHISAFQPRPLAQARPQVGQRLKFVVGIDHGRKRAQQVLWRNVEPGKARASLNAANAQRGQKQAGGGAYLLLMAFLLVLLVVALAWDVPSWVFSLYAVMSLLTFFAYWKDKAAAQAGRWRTPESTLHVLALMGGWPGALLAQQWLRHKSSKRAFRTVLGLMVLVNVGVFVWLSSPWGHGWAALLQILRS